MIVGAEDVVEDEVDVLLLLLVVMSVVVDVSLSVDEDRVDLERVVRVDRVDDSLLVLVIVDSSEVLNRLDLAVLVEGVVIAVV